MGSRTYESVAVGERGSERGQGMNWKKEEGSCGKTPWEAAEAKC